MSVNRAKQFTSQIARVRYERVKWYRTRKNTDDRRCATRICECVVKVGSAAERGRGVWFWGIAESRVDWDEMQSMMGSVASKVYRERCGEEEAWSVQQRFESNDKE